jgi:gliding motility-associated-like protein/uncharacterized repeat protein (TIGR01451 family)
LVNNPQIAIVKTATASWAEGTTPQIGDTITYAFTVTNIGNVPLSNVSVTDPRIINGSLAYVSGDTDDDSILDLTETWTYTATYELTRDDIVAGQVENQATATGYGPETPQYPNGQPATDLSDHTNPTTTDNNPTVVYFNGCEITVYNAVTPNGDGYNDYFFINGFDCYAKNEVEIYNRWGVLVYDVQGYDNQDELKRFNGYSNGRAVYKQGEGLPTGTYYYVIKYTDANGTTNSKAGYLYLTRD